MGIEAIYIKIIRQCVWLVIVAVCATNVNAQEKTKSTMKKPMSDISISFMDIMSKNISYSDLAVLEKSYHGMSDRSYVHDKMVFSLLYSEPPKEDGDSSLRDTSFYAKISDCPHICRLRMADPLLVVTGVFCYKVYHSDSFLSVAYQQYMAWQPTKVPHSPLAKNAPPDNYNFTQKQKWLCLYTKDWVQQYPDEYHFMLHQFDSFFVKYNAQKPGSNYSDFLIYYSKLVQHDYDKSVDFLLRASPEGLKPTINKPILPSDEFMQAKPKEFIKDAYESLYLREPSEEESVFLEKFINEHKELTVKQFYYGMMTSDEYKYY